MTHTRNHPSRLGGRALRAGSLAAVGLALASLGLPGCGVLITNTILVFALSTETDEVQEVPRVTGVWPTRGPVEGGTEVTVYGYWFKDGCAVDFGAAQATDVRVLSRTELVCRTPPWTGVKRVGVGVRNPDGRSADRGEAYSYWWNGDWARRSSVTITGSAAGALADVQVKVVAAYDAEMRADFGDLRFTSVAGASETLLPCWLETSTPSASATFWVRVPAVPASPGTVSIWAYFGNPLATSASDFTATFTKEFQEAGLVGLWHLDEGAGSVAEDASGNGHDALLQNFSPASWVSRDGGQWGSRADVWFPEGSFLTFDAVNDFVSAGTAPGLSFLNQMTIEAWVRPDSPSASPKAQPLVSRWQQWEDLSTASWTAFDAGAAGLDGPAHDPDGFSGAVFDGRYVYFVPLHNGADYHGEVLRYDSRGSFSALSSWESFDPGAIGLDALGFDLDGYYGAAFDGRYVYFAPYYNGTAQHGGILRYDTQGAFQSLASWLAYDPGTAGLDAGGFDPDGFYGAVFDGRYVYFVPYHNGTAHSHEVLRYDTSASFTTLASWAAYAPAGALGGYRGAVFDGRYVYFSPHLNPSYHGQVLRYDTAAVGGFSGAGSWAVFDPGSAGLDAAGHDPDGFCGAVFDGRYVYFAPYHNGSAYHGEVLRYDTQAAFASVGSWAAFDPGTAGFDALGVPPDGYLGAVFDGRYVLFVPHRDGAGYHGRCLRFDTSGSFETLSSWSVFDPGPASLDGLGRDPDGFVGAVSDGRYVYFAPYYNGTGQHGEVLRLDTTGNGASYLLLASAPAQGGGFSGSAGGLWASLNTDAGHFGLRASASPSPGAWHHVALTYDGATLALLLDGQPAGSRPATGFVVNATAPLLFGRIHDSRPFFNGGIDEVRMAGRALPAWEIRAHYERRIGSDPEPVASALSPKEGP